MLQTHYPTLRVIGAHTMQMLQQCSQHEKKERGTMWGVRCQVDIPTTWHVSSQHWSSEGTRLQAVTHTSHTHHSHTLPLSLSQHAVLATTLSRPLPYQKGSNYESYKTASTSIDLTDACSMRQCQWMQPMVEGHWCVYTTPSHRNSSSPSASPRRDSGQLDR